MLIERNSILAYLMQRSLKGSSVEPGMKFLIVDCTIVEGQVNIQEDLVQVEGCAFLVQYDRLLKLTDLAYGDGCGPYDKHLLSALRAILDDLPGIVLAEGEADDKVVDESLLAAHGQRFELLKIIAEQ